MRNNQFLPEDIRGVVRKQWRRPREPTMFWQDLGANKGGAPNGAIASDAIKKPLQLRCLQGKIEAAARKPVRSGWWAGWCGRRQARSR